MPEKEEGEGKGKEEEEPKYQKLSRKDLESIAKEVRGVKGHAERHEHVIHALTGYRKSPVVEAEHREPVMELMTGGKASDMQGIYKGIHDAHVEKKGDLGDSVVREWLQKFADTIMPTMKAGVEKETEANYRHLRLYLKEFDEMANQQPGMTELEVRQLIAEGHGFEASAKIIEAIKKVKKQHEFAHFREMLLPADDYEFKEAAAKKLANVMNKDLRARGESKYRIDPGKVGDNLSSAYVAYIDGDAKGMMRYATKRKKSGGKS
jgi:hypothetical protein